MTQNPLEKLYRHKKLYVSLPSGGRFYHSGIKLSADGEIGVMPMSAVDEIKLKTPDSLFNGEALFDLFKSCVPDIENPEEMPICDVDKLLIAIRVATSGTDLDVKGICPKCGKEEVYQIDLTTIMNTAQDIPQDNVVKLGEGVEVELNPLTLRSQIKNQIETFYQFRMQQMITDDSTDEEKKAQIFDEALLKAITIQTSQVADCILKVTLLEGSDEIVVTDKDQIFQWVENIDSHTHAAIKDALNELSDPHMQDVIKIQCPDEENCGHTYETKVDLNPVNFF